MNNEQLKALQSLLRLVIDNAEIIADYEGKSKVDKIMQDACLAINDIALQVSSAA